MNAKKSPFDERASGWDDKPSRVKLAQDVANAILEEVAVGPDMDVLDFGCGTGLLTLRLQPLARSVMGADTSRGMLDVLSTKVESLGLPNVKLLLLASETDDLGGVYHLIVSSMTLHHVQDIAPLLKRLHASLLPGGLLCLADLDSEGGRFHEDNTGVHHQGFERRELGDMIKGAGFEVIRDRTVATVVKPTADGGEGRFTVFLLVGRKG